MLAKPVTPGRKEWEDRLPYVLFAYRATQHVSVGESPFFLVYGRDPKLPTETALCPPNYYDFLDLDDYKSVMLQGMSTAWDRAQKSLLKAQKQQKKQHNNAAKKLGLSHGRSCFCVHASDENRTTMKAVKTIQGFLLGYVYIPEWSRSSPYQPA